MTSTQYYVCENPDCKKFGEKDIITKERFFYRNGELVGEHAECPNCRKIRKYVNPNESIPLSKKEGAYCRFSSSSVEDKRAVLKKRAHEHYNKEVRERKESLMGRAMKEMRSLGKE